MSKKSPRSVEKFDTPDENTRALAEIRDLVGVFVSEGRLSEDQADMLLKIDDPHVAHHEFLLISKKNYEMAKSAALASSENDRRKRSDIKNF